MKSSANSQDILRVVYTRMRKQPAQAMFSFSFLIVLYSLFLCRTCGGRRSAFRRRLRELLCRRSHSRQYCERQQRQYRGRPPSPLHLTAAGTVQHNIAISAACWVGRTWYTRYTIILIIIVLHGYRGRGVRINNVNVADLPSSA